MSFAVICSGQGAQTGKLFQSFPFTDKACELRARLIEANCFDADVAAWLNSPSPDPDLLFKNHFSQPLLCLFQLMVWEELRDLTPTPRLIAGYSLGELSAYGCAGALAAADVVRLAGIRARVMSSSRPGELVAVTGLKTTKAYTLAGERNGFLAIVLGQDHCVLGCAPGSGNALVQELLAGGAATAEVLKVEVPSHTPFLDSAVEPFREALRIPKWSVPACPILAGINAKKVLTQPQMLEVLPEQIHQTVRWDQVEQRIAEAGCRVVLELGPGSQLAHAMLAGNADGDVRSAGEFRSPEGIADWVRRSVERFG